MDSETVCGNRCWLLLLSIITTSSATTNSAPPISAPISDPALTLFCNNGFCCSFSQFAITVPGRAALVAITCNCHFPWVLSPLGEGQSRLMNALQGYEGLIFCHTLLSKSDQCDHWPWTPSNWGERQDGGKGLDLGQFV